MVLVGRGEKDKPLSFDQVVINFIYLIPTAIMYAASNGQSDLCALCKQKCCADGRQCRWVLGCSSRHVTIAGPLWPIVVCQADARQMLSGCIFRGNPEVSRGTLRKVHG